MDANLMRLAWSVVDETPPSQGQSLSLDDRIGDVVREIDNRALLSPQERQEVQQYLADRQHLIAELYQ